jgi:hypothetical protein
MRLRPGFEGAKILKAQDAPCLQDGVCDVAYCSALDRAATCGGNTVKFIDMKGLEFKVRQFGRC